MGKGGDDQRGSPVRGSGPVDALFERVYDGPICREDRRPWAWRQHWYCPRCKWHALAASVFPDEESNRRGCIGCGGEMKALVQGGKS